MGENSAQDLKGRVKEAVGDVTGDEGLKREGKVDQASAATKDAVKVISDTVKDAVNPKE